MSEADVIDAEVVEPSTEIVEAPSRQALMPLDAADVVRGMTAYQELLPQLLDDSDYQAADGKRFVKKSGWRKIARAFNLSVTIVEISVERDENGKSTRAECVARAKAPNGQVQDADGYCSIDEFTGKRADDKKLENTLRATATTRAKNRAIADLVGMGEVSAEEVTQTGQTAPAVERADEDLQRAAKQSLGRLVGDPQIAGDIWRQALGYFGDVAPRGLCVAVIAIGGGRADAEQAKAGS